MDLNKHRIGAYIKGSGKAAPAAADQAPAAKPPAATARPAAAKAQPAAAPGTQSLIKTTPGKAPAARPGGKPAGGKPTRADIARYLVLIGQEDASNILRHLDPAEVEAIAKEIAAIPSIGPDEAKEVLERFRGLVAAGVPAAGGVDTARDMLVNAFGPEKGGQILRQALPEEKEPFFDYLAELEPAQVALLLRDESIGARCIVLGSLPPPLAAAVIKQLPRGEQKDLIVRMSKMGKVEREVVERIDAALRLRVKDLASGASEDLNGSSNLAAIMRHLDPDLEQRLLGDLQEAAPEVVETIKDHLFTVDTVLQVEDRDLQKVLQTMENKQIALLLKGKDEKVRRKLLDNVSDNRAATITEDFLALGPKPKREVDAATRDFIAMLRALEQDGKIVVRRDDEMYV